MDNLPFFFRAKSTNELRPKFFSKYFLVLCLTLCFFSFESLATSWDKVQVSWLTAEKGAIKVKFPDPITTEDVTEWTFVLIDESKTVFDIVERHWLTANELVLRASNIEEAAGAVFLTINMNADPTFTSTPVTTVSEGETYTYTVLSTDPDGDLVNLAGTVLPSWLSLTSTSIEVSTFAGSNAVGDADGTGTAASFDNPDGMAFDSNGNLFVADGGNNLIRKITPAGVVSTFAGSGNAASVDGTGTAASFRNPVDLVIDASDNIYVIDRLQPKVRKITPAGVVSSFAGTGSEGFTDGAANVARFKAPQSITIDADGNLYVVDTGNNRIRKITPDGTVSTLAGSGNTGDADGNGTSASFDRPMSIVIDASGDFLVSDQNNDLIRKITPAGEVTTIVGSGTRATVDGNGTSASLNAPDGLAFDASGNLYVSDYIGHYLRVITPGLEVITLAGTGTGGSTNGDRSVATFNLPKRLIFDNSGNLYVSETLGDNIRKVTVPMLTGSSSGQGGVHNVTLTTTDGNGGSATQVFTVTVSETTPPVFENNTPSSSNTVSDGFTLSTDIDEAGTLYYVVVPDGDTAPTAAEVKAGQASGGGAALANGSQAVTTDPFTHDFSITGLTLGTTYDVYVVAEDAAATPNLQDSPQTLEVSTTTNVVITFDDQGYTDEQNLGSSVTLKGMTFEYKEQGEAKGLIVNDESSASGLAINASNSNQTSGDNLVLTRSGGGNFGLKSLHISGTSSLGRLGVTGYINDVFQVQFTENSPTDGAISFTDPVWSNLDKIDIQGAAVGLVVNFDDIDIDLLSATDLISKIASTLSQALPQVVLPWKQTLMRPEPFTISL